MNKTTSTRTKTSLSSKHVWAGIIGNPILCELLVERPTQRPTDRREPSLVQRKSLERASHEYFEERRQLLMARSDQKKKKKKNGTLMLSVKQSQPHFIEDSFKILFLQNSFRQNVVKKNCEKKFYQNEAGREGEQVF